MSKGKAFKRFRPMPKDGLGLDIAFSGGPYIGVSHKPDGGLTIYLPVVLTGEDNGHPCDRCESPTAWGRKWCFNLHCPVNADACKRIRRKPSTEASAYFLGRLLAKRKPRGSKSRGALVQSHKRDGAVSGSDTVRGQHPLSLKAGLDVQGKTLSGSHTNGAGLDVQGTTKASGATCRRTVSPKQTPPLNGGQGTGPTLNDTAHRGVKPDAVRLDVGIGAKLPYRKP